MSFVLNNEHETLISQPNRKNRCCNCSLLTKCEKLILVLGTCGLIITLITALITLFNYSHNNVEDRIFAIITIICSVMTFGYLYRGIFGERSYELMIYVISATCLMFYVIINFTQTFHDTKNHELKIIKLVKLVTVIIIGLSTSVIGFVLAYNYNVRGDLIFRTVGGFEQLQDICKNLFVFEALLLLDLQFAMVIVILVMGLNKDFGTLQTAILGAGVPFSLIWVLIGFYAMRFENKVLAIIFFILGFLEPSYVIYLFVKSIKIIIASRQIPMTEPVEPIVSVTFACCILAIVIRVILLIMHIVVYRNFDNGLKNKLTFKFTGSQTEQDTLSNDLNSQT